MMRTWTIVSMLSLLIPAMLWAQEPTGTITGKIGTHDVDVPFRADQSDFYGDGNSGGVSIMTRPVARDDGLGALSIGFEGADFPGGGIFRFEVDIGDTYAENGSEYFANLNHGLQVTITRAEKRDEVLTIAGTVKGPLIWRQLMPITEQKEDPSRQISIDLALDGVLVNEY